MVDKDKLADRVLAKSFRENPREASLKDQAGMLRAIRDPLTNRAFNMDGCAALEASKQEDTCTLCGMYGHQCARCKASKQEAQGGQVPDGWKLVPIEPCDLLLNSFLAGYGARGGSFNAMHLRDRARAGYLQMLEAVDLAFERGIYTKKGGGNE